MKILENYYHLLGALLVVGCVFHPFASAMALLIVFTAKHAEKYLTPNIADADRRELQSLKTEFQIQKSELLKLKAKSDQSELGKAFRS